MVKSINYSEELYKIKRKSSLDKELYEIRQAKKKAPKEEREEYTQQEKDVKTKYKIQDLKRKKVKEITELPEKVITSILKKPLLKKPSVSVPTISSKKLLKQYANSGYSMFKSEGRDYQPQEHPVQDNRSLFFQETLNRERQNNRGWL